MDYHGYAPNHRPVRLRQTKVYDVQFDERDLPAIMAQFGLHPPHTAGKPGRAYSLKYKENPIKHGRIQAFLLLPVKLFGWIFGFTAPCPTKEKYTGPLVPLDCIQVYPIALGKDNVMINDADAREEEWL
jgi:hypothetical protein